MLAALKQPKQIIEDGQNEGRLGGRYSSDTNNQLEDSIPEGELQGHMETQETVEYLD